ALSQLGHPLPRPNFANAVGQSSSQRELHPLMSASIFGSSSLSLSCSSPLLGTWCTKERLRLSVPTTLPPWRANAKPKNARTDFAIDSDGPFPGQLAPREPIPAPRIASVRKTG